MNDSPPESIEINLTVNGKPRSGRCEPRKLLVDFLREDLVLTGTHAGCEHGICGACTILIDGEAARSCITLAVQANGAELVTIEGLAQNGVLHPLQQAFAKFHGLQCGFCTPGMLMIAMEVVRDKPDATRDEIREIISGNYCRCTGYQAIVNAIESVLIAKKVAA